MEIKNMSIRVGNQEMAKAVLAYLVSVGYTPYSSETHTYGYLQTCKEFTGNRVEGAGQHSGWHGRVRFDADTEFDKIVAYVTPKPVKKLTYVFNGVIGEIGFTNKHVTITGENSGGYSGTSTIRNEVVKAAYELIKMDLSDCVMRTPKVDVTFGHGVFTKEMLTEIVEHPHFGVGA